MDRRDAVKPLNYAPRAIRSPWYARQVLVFLACYAFLVAAYLWGSACLQRAETLIWEYRAAHFTLPPDHLVFEVAAGIPTKAESTGLENGPASTPLSRTLPASSYGTLLLHELHQPDGTPRLILIRVCPNQFLGSMVDGGRQLSVNCVDLRSGTWIGLDDFLATARADHWRFWYALIDPANPSHFTFDYELDARRHTADGWLNNQDQILLSSRP